MLRLHNRYYRLDNQRRAQRNYLRLPPSSALAERLHNRAETAYDAFRVEYDQLIKLGEDPKYLLSLTYNASERMYRQTDRMLSQRWARRR